MAPLAPPAGEARAIRDLLVRASLLHGVVRHAAPARAGLLYLGYPMSDPLRDRPAHRAHLLQRQQADGASENLFLGEAGAPASPTPSSIDGHPSSPQSCDIPRKGCRPNHPPTHTHTHISATRHHPTECANPPTQPTPIRSLWRQSIFPLLSPCRRSPT